jgi:hypothetical protein
MIDLQYEPTSARVISKAVFNTSEAAHSREREEERRDKRIRNGVLYLDSEA